MDGVRYRIDELLVSRWLPALKGVTAKLALGASVADIGCGYGYAALRMAQAYPLSRFRGFDIHGPSIRMARRMAEEWGLDDRVSFEVAHAEHFPGDDYELVGFFDSRHGLGDPGEALRRAEHALAPNGTVIIVERAPAAGHEILRAIAEGAGLRAWRIALDTSSERIYELRR